MAKEVFDIYRILDYWNFKNKRRNNPLKRAGFTLESDLQFTIATAIQETYKNAKVIMEYNALSEEIKENWRRNIDILVIFEDKYIPIELKYKHSECYVALFEGEDECYKLAEHSNLTDIRSSYAEDIKRIIDASDKEKSKIANNFYKGYAILLTNLNNLQENKYNKNDFHNAVDEEFKKEKITLKDDNKEIDVNISDCKMKWIKSIFSYSSDNCKNAKDNNFYFLVTEIPKKCKS